ELVPVQHLVDKGLSSVMIGHLELPALEERPGFPASLSKPIVTGLLQREMGFEGLIFTDALNMRAVTQFAPEGEVELQAFLAGNDMLLMPENVAKAKEVMIRAYKRGKITEARLEHSVKKILMAKYKVGLLDYEPIDLQDLHRDLNSVGNQLLYEEVIEAAITVPKNNFSLMPVKKLDNKKIAYVQFGDADGAPFLERMNKYYTVTQVKASDLAGYKEALAGYNLVIIGFHKSNDSPWKGYTFKKDELEWIQEISRMRTSNTILAVFAKPYALLDVENFQTIDGLLLAYQNSELAQEKAAEVLFGALGAHGRLPVSAHGEFPEGSGLDLQSLQRLGYTIPERVGMDSKALARVDTLVRQGIDSLMTPGAQVLVVRRGKVIYNKNFGDTTYASGQAINDSSRYDLASLTKILSTLPMIMNMEEQGKIALNNTFGELIPEYVMTELKDVTVLNPLSHYGRLPAWIAFYIDTLDKSRRPSADFYRQQPSEAFPYKVAEHLYLTREFKDSIYNRIGRQSLKSNRYRYSDLAYYVLKEYIEDTYGRPMDELVDEFLYRPLGLRRTTFNPLEKFPKQEI